MTAEEILEAIKYHGLFIARLNNGDWMCGRALSIYHIEITDDHYADPGLSISSSLEEAVTQAVTKFGREEIKSEGPALTPQPSGDQQGLINKIVEPILGFCQGKYKDVESAAKDILRIVRRFGDEDRD